MSDKLLIRGGAGSGKTTLLLDRFVEVIKAGAGKRSLFVVPAFSYINILREMLLTKYQLSGFFDDCFTTFSSLSERIIQEAGLASVIGEHLKWIIMSDILEKDGFPYFTMVKDFPGFKRNCIGLIRSFKESGASPDDLERFLGNTSISRDGDSQQKHNAVINVYRRYQEFLSRGNLMDYEDYITHAYNKLVSTGDFASTIEFLYVDGFHEFTPVEFKILTHLAENTANVLITLPGETPHKRSVFDASGRFRDTLIACGLEEHYLDENPGNSSKTLDAVAKTVFQKEAPQVESVDESLRIVKAIDIDDEVEQVARAISRLVLEDEYAYEDICIIARSISAYASALENILQQYEIPFSLHYEKPLTDIPFIKTVSVLCSALVSGAKQEEVLALLKSGYLRVENGECARFEIEHPRGNAHRFIDKWKGVAQDMGLNSIVGALTFLEECFAKFSALTTADELKRFFSNIFRKFLCWAYAGKIEAGNELFARQQFSAADTVFGLLDDITVFSKTSPDGQMPVRKTVSRLLHLISIGTVNVSDKLKNTVAVGDVRKARLWRKKVAFVVGLLENEFPKPARENVFLKDKAISALSGKAELSLKTSAKIWEMEKYFFYTAITRSSEKLFLSYPLYDSTGSPNLESFFLEELEKLLPAEAPESIIVNRDYNNLIVGKDDIATRSDAIAFILHQFDQPFKVDTSPLTDEQKLAIALYNAIISEPHAQTLFERALPFSRPVSTEVRLNFPETLFDRTFSQSEFSDYAQCPYLYFARYILKLKDFDVLFAETVGAADMGTVLHKVLARFVKSDGKENILDIFTRIYETETKHLPEDLFSSKARENARRRLLEITEEQKEFIDAALQTIRQEASFGFGEGGVPLVIVHPEFGEIPICGRIDRIDVIVVDDKQYGLVIDYKYSSSTSINAKIKDTIDGFDFQLPLYILAAKELFKIEPAGALFYSLRDAETFKSTIICPDKLGAAVPKFLKGKHISPGEFEQILTDTREKIVAFITAMHKGIADIIPRNHDRCGMNKCPFASLCRIEKYILSEGGQ